MDKDKTQPNGASLGVGRRLWTCTCEGAHKGLRTAVWLVCIMVPIGLAVMLLQYFRLLDCINPYLQPIFTRLGLPAESVVACVSGGLLNVYSGIAALGAVPLTDRQLTILAMMILISHNLPVESAIQHKAGTSVWRMSLLRIAFSFVAGYLLNLILPAGDGVARARGVMGAAQEFWPALGGWAEGMAWLAGRMCAIVMGLMILQRILREFKVMDYLAIPLTPVLWLLGLPRRLSFLWIVANIVGLAYGSAIILEEVQIGALTRKDAQLLNRSMAICHSLLEDTLLFVAIGAWAYWITLPRLVLAAAVVWTYRAVMAVWGSLVRQKT